MKQDYHTYNLKRRFHTPKAQQQVVSLSAKQSWSLRSLMVSVILAAVVLIALSYHINQHQQIVQAHQSSGHQLHTLSIPVPIHPH